MQQRSAVSSLVQTAVVKMSHHDATCLSDLDQAAAQQPPERRSLSKIGSWTTRVSCLMLAKRWDEGEALYPQNAPRPDGAKEWRAT